MRALDQLIQRAADGSGDDQDGVCSVHLEAGDVLMEEGDAAAVAYLLVSGALTVTKTVDGTVLSLGVIDQPGSLVGEIALLGGGKRSATVIAQRGSHLLSLSSERLAGLMAQDPEMGEWMSVVATRRAEESELAEILVGSFGVSDPDAVTDIVDLVEWRHLERGEVLFQEGDDSKTAYFVVRGRVVVTQRDDGADVAMGEIGRGEMVGELGLLENAPRTGTASARRPSLLACLSHADFLDVLDRHPRLMVGVGRQILARARGSASRHALRRVFAIVCAGDLDSRLVTSRLQAELQRLGTSSHLWPARVDALLDSPGAAMSRPGDPAELGLTRLLREAELEVDHLLLELGENPGEWGPRCLDLADGVLIFMSRDVSASDLESLARTLARSSDPCRRTLVMVHPAEGDSPAGTAGLMQTIGADEVLHLKNITEYGRVARMVTGRATGLVLGGGGARGFAHIGVFRALSELGLSIDLVGGTSLGATLGAAIADGVRAEELGALAEKRFADVLDYTIPVVSLIKGERIAASIEEAFGQREIEDLWSTFFCISTNLTTSRLEVHRRGSLIHALRASSSVPGMMPPVPWGDDLLVDGGVLNNLPVDVARSLAPAGRIVGVDVAPVRGPGAREDYGLSVSGWRALRARSGSQKKSFPRLTSILMRSMILASQQERDRQVSQGVADLYLDLDLRGVSMFDFDAVLPVAQRGYEAAMPVLEEWLSSEGAP